MVCILIMALGEKDEIACKFWVTEKATNALKCIPEVNVEFESANFKLFTLERRSGRRKPINKGIELARVFV